MLLAEGQASAQEGRQATRARGVRSGVGRAGYAGMWAGLHVQAQSAQGMGAQKRGAAPLLGSGKARGVGVRRFGAALCVEAQHRQGASARLSSAFARRRSTSASVALIVVFIKVIATALVPVPGYFSKI